MFGIARCEGPRDSSPFCISNIFNDLIAQCPFAEGRKPLSKVGHAASGAGIARPERIDIAEQMLIYERRKPVELNE